MKATNDRVSSVTEYREGLGNLFLLVFSFLRLAGVIGIGALILELIILFMEAKHVKTVQILTEACRYDREGLDMAFIR